MFYLVDNDHWTIVETFYVIILHVGINKQVYNLKLLSYIFTIE